MRICVWRTGHPIADTVADAVFAGLDINSIGVCYTDAPQRQYSLDEYDIHIGYGILRGMAEVFRECDRQGKPWFCIDKGYFKPGHFDGYYRVSMRGTQQVSGWPEPDNARWWELNIPIAEPENRGVYTLVCPPTDYVKEFFNDGTTGIPVTALAGRNYRVQEKDEFEPIDWAGINRVVTCNSSVGWQALQRGLPVVSHPFHSIVGAWQAKHGLNKRAELFATMAGLQLTLDEMRAGKLWPLMEKLLAKQMA